MSWRTAPRSAEVTMDAYALSALETVRLRLRGVYAAFPRACSALRLRSISPDSSLTFIVRAGMSMSIVSPSAIRAISPPAAASGETCPIERPDVPPEKRPSVIRAHSLPRCLDFR